MSSEGPDKIFMTQHDVRAIVTVESHTIQQQQEMVSEEGGTSALSILHPEHPWFEKQKLMLKKQ